MTTFTATPNSLTGTVQISINKTATVTELIRSDVNGTRPVRVLYGALPSVGAGDVGITDHEASLTGDVVYSLDGITQRTRFAPRPRPRFTLPFHPEMTVAVDTITRFETSRDSAGTEHEIIGRADPIIATAAMRSRRGTIDAGLDTYEQALELESLLKLGKTVMFRQADNYGQDLYFHTKAVNVTKDDIGWQVSASFTELRYPTGSRSGTGWTFEDLAAGPGATFMSTAIAYDSFDTLSIGQEL